MGVRHQSRTQAGTSARVSAPHDASVKPETAKAGGALAAATAFAKASMPGLMVNNPEQFARNMLATLEEGGKAFSDYIARAGTPPNPLAAASDMNDTSKTLSEVYKNWASDPQSFATAQSQLMKGYMELWNGAIRKTFGMAVEPVATPAPNDNRFKDPDWSQNPYFDFLKQAHLLTAQWSERMLANSVGMDERTRQKADFLFRQMSSAFSPSNFPLTNPEVIRETLASNGQNLVHGMSNLASDMKKSGEMLNISQTDITAFEVGRDLAVTPGKVIFQNELIQLIQYAPATAKVVETPLLIIPPWINKFYILDLTQEKSMIKYLVDNGLSVFVVSWVNPDQTLSQKTFEDYIGEGLLAAADAVTRETGVAQPNVVGYCVGGTLLSTGLAWLAAKNIERFNTATFFAAQADFSKAGDLKLFIDDEQLASLEKLMAEKGYLEGSRMATVFNMLRPRDLIWPYIINNYMLGKKPFAFDLLYWNQDSTRMPPANHIYYLREFYQHNKLAKGEMVIAGEKLDLSKVTLPIYELAAREDHIAPAESVFIGSRLYGGPVRYVMGGSGHIAGVINPPYKTKYQYWTSESMAGTFQAWLKGAKETPGSWWPDWVRWLKEHSEGEIAARRPGAKLGVIEDAPGSYVQVKS